MFKAIHNLFNELVTDSITVTEPDLDARKLAMAALLCEVSNADQVSDPRELACKLKLLANLFNFGPQQAAHLLERAQQCCQRAVSVYEFTSQLRLTDYQHRTDLIAAMWEVSFADGSVDTEEEALIRKVADLLYVEHKDFIQTKLAVQQKIAGNK